MPLKPVFILTGFLGAGKTTLLNQILATHTQLKYALIINEFGEMGLDASLIQNPGEFVEMNNGCLCCALNEDLVKTLQNLQARNDYDAVILETSGVADPLTIGWTFLREQFQNTFSLSSIITVIDPVSFDLLKNDVLYLEQIRPANVLYISKTSQINPADLNKLISEIQTINPRAAVFTDDKTNWFETLTLSEVDINKLLESKSAHTNHAKFESISQDLTNKNITLEEMEDYFESLPASILRAKAVFWDFKKEKYFALHLVTGRITFEVLNKTPDRQAMVLIGVDLKKDLSSAHP